MTSENENQPSALPQNFAENKKEKLDLRDCTEPSVSELNEAHSSPEYQKFHIQREVLKYNS